MKKVHKLFVELAKTVQGWNRSTVGIIMAVALSVACYNLAKFLKVNKSDGKAVMSWSALFMMLLSIGIMVLLIKCLNYRGV